MIMKPVLLFFILEINISVKALQEYLIQRKNAPFLRMHYYEYDRAVTELILPSTHCVIALMTTD